MYHPAIVHRRLDDATSKLGWTPVPHSLAKVQEWKDHLDSILDDEGRLNPRLRPNGLTPKELQWVKNERKMCQASFCYAATRYFYIQDTEQRIIRFNPNIAQELNLQIWQEHELKGWPIEIIQLK